MYRQEITVLLYSTLRVRLLEIPFTAHLCYKKPLACLTQLIERYKLGRRKHYSCTLLYLPCTIQVDLISYSGLGAGISATSFARQNIDVTVIEIDPAVYNASLQYFGLPDLDSDRVFLDDARFVVAEKRRSAQQYGHSNADKYDYVVHDCFSGGGVPAHLFTLQFWEDLKAIMNPEGVVAVVSLSMHYE